MLELCDVDGSYGQIQAVRSLNLAVTQGRSLALLGRNGAGKSTVLKLISGMLRPAAGTVTWQGAVVNDLPPEKRVRLGIVLAPEGRGIFPALSAEENVKMGAYWDRPRKVVLAERLDRVYTWLNRLPALRERTAGSLSGGEQQMVAVARALMSEPQILLLDEPSLGLAPVVVDLLYETFAQLKATGLSIVLVEQYITLALSLCDEVIGLDKGRVVVSGPAADLVGSEALQDMYMAREMA